MLMLKLLSDVLSAPVNGPIHGFTFILNALREQVESEALDESKLQGELMQLGMRYQAGEMTDAEYEAKEDALLEQMNEIRRYKESLAQDEADLIESTGSDEDEVREYPAAGEEVTP